MSLPDMRLSLLSLDRHTGPSWPPEVGPVLGSELSLWQSGGHIYTWLGPQGPTGPLWEPQEDGLLHNNRGDLSAWDTEVSLTTSAQVLRKPRTFFHPAPSSHNATGLRRDFLIRHRQTHRLDISSCSSSDRWLNKMWSVLTSHHHLINKPIIRSETCPVGRLHPAPPEPSHRS